MCSQTTAAKQKIARIRTNTINPKYNLLLLNEETQEYEDKTLALWMWNLMWDRNDSDPVKNLMTWAGKHEFTILVTGRLTEPDSRKIKQRFESLISSTNGVGVPESFKVKLKIALTQSQNLAEEIISCLLYTVRLNKNKWQLWDVVRSVDLDHHRYENEEDYRVFAEAAIALNQHKGVFPREKEDTLIMPHLRYINQRVHLKL